MIRKVMHHDLLQNRKPLLISGAGYFLFMIYSSLQTSGPVVFLVFASLMASFLSTTVVTREDRWRATPTLLSMPLRRKTVVRARYLSMHALSLGGVALAILISVLLADSRPAAASVLRFEYMFLSFSIVLILLSSVIPFVLRFGFVGLLVFLISVQLLGVVLMGISSMSRGSRALRFNVGELFAGLNRTVGMLRATLGDPLFYLAATLALGFLVAASIWISTRIVERRDY